MPPPARSVKLKLPQVNWRLKRGPLQHYKKHSSRSSTFRELIIAWHSWGGTGSSESLTLASESVAILIHCTCARLPVQLQVCFIKLYQQA